MLVSILVMTIGFAGLSAMQLVASRSGQQARSLAEATQLCRSKVEELSMMPLPLPAAPAGGEVLDARGCRLTGDARLFCRSPMPGTRYRRTWTVDAATGRFSVEVRWLDGAGKQHRVVVIGAR